MAGTKARPNDGTRQQAAAVVATELNFEGSPATTLGVEIELQIIDPPTGELVPGARRILDACADEGIEGADGEFLLSMLEVRTGICSNVTEVRDSLLARLRRVRNIAAALGYDLALGGTHPNCRACMTAISPGERYQRIGKRQGWLAYQEAIFGLHVHVGVPDGARAIALINYLVPYLPHFAALAANSPFWQGIDTGFASSRLVMFNPSPHTGVPLHCADWSEFCRFYRIMHDAEVFETINDLYWDIRPRHDLGTIEVRIFDAPASLSVLLGLTALTRCMVIDGLRLIDERPDLCAGDARAFWLAAENRGRAARFGLQAECVRRPGRSKRILADDTAELLDRISAVATAAGEAEFLEVFQPLDRFQLGADLQRRLARQTGGWHAVIEALKTGWVSELAQSPGVDDLVAARPQ